MVLDVEGDDSLRCSTCYMKNACDSQTEFICKSNNYCKYLDIKFFEGDYAKKIRCGRTENGYIDDIKEKLPEDVWERARNDVLSSGNQGIWTMCLVAVEILSEFWKDEHEGY